MRIIVIIELAFYREEYGKLVAAGSIVPNDTPSRLAGHWQNYYGECEGGEGSDSSFVVYPWMASACDFNDEWDIRFPSPSVYTPYNDHELEFINNSIRRALATYTNKFAYADD